MRLEDLASLLRCLGCGGELRLGAARLDCPGCGRSYPVVEGIPVMAEPGTEEEIWGERYFQTLSGSVGDSEAANGYLNGRSFRNVRDGVLELIGLPTGQTILDIGCGTGHFSRSLAAENRLVGVDISLDMARLAKEKGLAAVRSSAKRLPFAGQSFSLVMSNNLLQSFREAERFVGEAARVLHPGGRLILTTANGQNLAMAVFHRLERKKYSHLWSYSADDLRHLVSGAGLGVRSLLFFDFWTGRVTTLRGDARAGWLRKRLAATVAVEAIKPA